MERMISFTLNGKETRVKVDDERPLFVGNALRSRPHQR